MRRFRRYIIPAFLLLLTYSAWQLWDIERVGHLDRDDKADCAIVLGAAAWHNKPSPVLRERLNHAITL
ncbi:YdcF family protein, partial [bacterium]|nr:YdcF family protein [bacterium]